MAIFFLSPESEIKFHREVPLFLEVPKFRNPSVGEVEGSLHAKNQLDSSSRFDTTPACDGQTDRHTTTASIASRGKSANYECYKESSWWLAMVLSHVA